MARPQLMLAPVERACDFTAAATRPRNKNGLGYFGGCRDCRGHTDVGFSQGPSHNFHILGRPRRVRILFIVLSVLPFAGEAFAEKRVALVIGNASYSHAPALDNPVNDVTAMSVMLEGAGFQVVEPGAISTIWQCAGRSATSRRRRAMPT